MSSDAHLVMNDKVNEVKKDTLTEKDIIFIRPVEKVSDKNHSIK